MKNKKEKSKFFKSNNKDLIKINKIKKEKVSVLYLKNKIMKIKLKILH